MRDAERRREIKDYYLGISADEITSYLTPASVDVWESVARYRRELTIGTRWLEVGGGMGDLAAAALDRGYDVLMTDVQDELLETAATRHPRLRTRLQRVDIFDARDVEALAARGPFSIVAALGAVLNHAPDRHEARRGLGHPPARSGQPGRRRGRSRTSPPAPVPRLTEPAAPAVERTRSSRWARSRCSSVLSSTLRP